MVQFRRRDWLVVSVAIALFSTVAFFRARVTNDVGLFFSFPFSVLPNFLKYICFYGNLTCLKTCLTKAVNGHG